jgi:hypothetical protein
MKEIQLTKGKKALVDDVDYEYLSQWKWHVGSHGYAVRTSSDASKRKILMHRVIMQTSEKMEADHISGDKLDNRRSNLRHADSSQNKMNKGPQCNNKSGYKGVCWHSQKEKWHAQIKCRDVKKSLGLHLSSEDAARAYDRAAIEYFGEFAYLNFGVLQ